MCPTCGCTHHLNVSAPDWYETLYPGIPKGELVPSACFDCWVTIRPGDSVLTRRWLPGLLSVEPGQAGTLESIRSDQGGASIYVVVLTSGKTVYLPRGAIKKCRD